MTTEQGKYQGLYLAPRRLVIVHHRECDTYGTRDWYICNEHGSPLAIDPDPLDVSRISDILLAGHCGTCDVLESLKAKGYYPAHAVWMLPSQQSCKSN